MMGNYERGNIRMDRRWGYTLMKYVQMGESSKEIEERERESESKTKRVGGLEFSVFKIFFSEKSIDEG